MPSVANPQTLIVWLTKPLWSCWYSKIGPNSFYWFKVRNYMLRCFLKLFLGLWNINLSFRGVIPSHRTPSDTARVAVRAPHLHDISPSICRSPGTLRLHVVRSTTSHTEASNTNRPSTTMLSSPFARADVWKLAPCIEGMTETSSNWPGYMEERGSGQRIVQRCSMGYSER